MQVFMLIALSMFNEWCSTLKGSIAVVFPRELLLNISVPQVLEWRCDLALDRAVPDDHNEAEVLLPRGSSFRPR